MLVNLALGSEAHREAILSRRPVLQGLKMALVGRFASAMRCRLVLTATCRATKAQWSGLRRSAQ